MSDASAANAAAAAAADEMPAGASESSADGTPLPAAPVARGGEADADAGPYPGSRVAAPAVGRITEARHESKESDGPLSDGEKSGPVPRAAAPAPAATSAEAKDMAWEDLAAAVAELKILLCSANLGNASPSDLGTWIPADGGKNDIIAVGVQEATWGGLGVTQRQHRAGLGTVKKAVLKRVGLRKSPGAKDDPKDRGIEGTQMAVRDKRRSTRGLTAEDIKKMIEAQEKADAQTQAEDGADGAEREEEGLDEDEDDVCQLGDGQVASAYAQTSHLRSASASPSAGGVGEAGEGEGGRVNSLDGSKVGEDGAEDRSTYSITVRLLEHLNATPAYESAGGGEGGTKEVRRARLPFGRRAAKSYSYQEGHPYVLLAVRRAGQMRLFIFCTPVVMEMVQDVELHSENTGVGHVMANKGGQLAKLRILGTTFAFYNAHLAAHEGKNHREHRCENVRDIISNCRVGQTMLEAPAQFSHCFFMGDLNFRVAEEGMSLKEVNERSHDLAEARRHDELFRMDELTKLMAGGRVFNGWTTPDCNWMPTFKVQRRSGYLYNAKRSPSFTDRVLYRSLPGAAKNLRLLEYTSHPDFVSSDHKPISARFSVKTHLPPQVRIARRHAPDMAILCFEGLKCWGLPVMDPEITGGRADPYILFYSDPPGLVRMRRGRGLGMRRKQRPRTATKKRTLEPVWEEDVRLKLNVQEGADLSNAHVILLVMDWDFSVLNPDDHIGTCVIPLDRIAGAGAEYAFEEKLYLGGEERGFISGRAFITSRDAERIDMRQSSRLTGFRKRHSISRDSDEHAQGNMRKTSAILASPNSDPFTVHEDEKCVIA